MGWSMPTPVLAHGRRLVTRAAVDNIGFLVGPIVVIVLPARPHRRPLGPGQRRSRRISAP